MAQGKPKKMICEKGHVQVCSCCRLNHRYATDPVYREKVRVANKLKAQKRKEARLAK